MDHSTCPVCGSPLKLKYRLRFNIYKCGNCGLLHSDAHFEHSFESDLASTSRDIGLKQLRLGNFSTIIEQLKIQKPNVSEGLEIGCGNGWWLETCKTQNIKCTGIEPEHIYENYHKENNLNVIYGFYPEVSPKKEGGYDFIIFNDVFEHIPDINSLVESMRADLGNDGILIINIPMSTGLFYRIATLLHKFGMSNSFTRMWQFNFHSPHMNYFNESNMKMLLQKHEFSCVDVFPLKSIDLQTTKERMLADKGMSKWKASVLTTALKLMKPIIKSAEPDIKAFFFKKN